MGGTLLSGLYSRGSIAAVNTDPVAEQSPEDLAASEERRRRWREYSARSYAKNKEARREAKLIEMSKVPVEERRRRWREYSARHYKKYREQCLARMRAYAKGLRDEATLQRMIELKQLGIEVADPVAACRTKYTFETAVSRAVYRQRAESLGLTLPPTHWAMADVVPSQET